IGRKLTAHALRHTHVSLLAEQGIDFETIARRVGHDGSKVTREIYFHVTKKLKERDDSTIASIHIL
ncbi:MAG: tyrosine-type recombinase/integrase, partial [Lachnospiraceae bacterium]|nr:tyrosine-type recombinase/integrase [Lachnospiraceae bacterium]